MQCWRPRRRSTNSNAGVRGGGGQRATLESEEEEDGGGHWRPRRRTEDNSGIKEEDNFTAGESNAKSNTLLVKRANEVNNSAGALANCMEKG